MKGHRRAPTLLSNTTWILGERAVRILTGFAVNLLALRVLAPSQFGTLSWAVSLVAILSPLLSQGLESIVPRELIRSRHCASGILGCAVRLKLMGSTAFVLLAGLIALTSTESSGERLQIVGILALGQLFQALDVFEFQFIARDDRRTPAMLRTLAAFASTAAKIGILLSPNPSLNALAFVIALEIGLPALAIAALGLGRHPLPDLTESRDPMSAIRAESLWSLLSAISTMVFLRMDQLIVDRILGESALGVYAAAVKLSEASYVIPIAMSTAAFPGLVAALRSDRPRFDRDYSILLRRSLGISALVAASIGIGGSRLVAWVAGPNYAEASAVLELYVWSLVPLAANQCAGKWLVAKGLTRQLALFQLVGAVANVAANLLLVPRFHLEGAAYATLGSYMFSSFFLPLAFRSTRMSILLVLRSPGGDAAVPPPGEDRSE